MYSELENQQAQFDSFLQRFGQNYVVLEIGAGVVVPSIRMEGESLGRKGEGLIRVNPSLNECAAMSSGRWALEDLTIGEAYFPLVARSDAALEGLCKCLGLG